MVIHSNQTINFSEEHLGKRFSTISIVSLGKQPYNIFILV